MTQVHKETLTIIENALPNRSGLDVEIFGMEGIPEDVVQAHNQRVLQSFAQAEAERRAATGNVGPGGSGANGVKKPKLESPADLKKRLAEHKAKKAAEEAAGISSGGNTPGGLGHDIGSPGMGQSPGAYVSSLHTLLYYLQLINREKAGSPGFNPPQMSYGAPPNNPGYSSLPQTYAQSQPPSFQPQQSPFPTQQSPFSPPGPPPYQNGQGFPPQQQFQPPPGQVFQPQFQNGPPNFQNGPSPNFQTGPPPPYQNGPPPQFQNGPPPQFQSGPPQFQNGPLQFQNGPPVQFQNGPPLAVQNGPTSQFQFQNGPPPQFGPLSPAPPFQQNQFQPPRTHTPPQHNAMSQRPGSLPPAPGLPQRPSFGAPPVNAFQMQQMHQGQLAGPPNPIDHPYGSHQTVQKGGPPESGLGPPPGSKMEPDAALSATASSLDDLVSGAAKDADNAAATAEPKAEAPKAKESQEEKKSKKEKDKNMKLIYSDNDVSPEEKMAKMPRYAFAPSG